MEDSQRKLELMLQCYFGKFHPIHGEQQIYPIGFGNRRTIIQWVAFNILQRGDSRGDVQTIRLQYQAIRDAYDSSPWCELDGSDEDFSVLFKTRELIPLLGSAIEDFISTRNQADYQRVTGIVKQMAEADSPLFADRIVALYKRLEGVSDNKKT